PPLAGLGIVLRSCLGGAGRQGIEAVLRLATDEFVRGCSGAVPERRVPIRPTRQCRGKSLYKTQQPACIQVRETVEGHNHAKSLIVVALVMRTSNDRWTSPDPASHGVFFRVQVRGPHRAPD